MNSVDTSALSRALAEAFVEVHGAEIRDGKLVVKVKNLEIKVPYRPGQPYELVFFDSKGVEVCREALHGIGLGDSIRLSVDMEIEAEMPGVAL